MKNDPRIQRLEAQAGGVPSGQDAQQPRYNLLRNFAAAHPTLHSSEASPAQRSLFEKGVARTFAQELSARMDNNQIHNPLALEALRKLDSFYLRQAVIDDAETEDWGDA